VKTGNVLVNALLIAQENSAEMMVAEEVVAHALRLKSVRLQGCA
jgi:hypothetical protein